MDNMEKYLATVFSFYCLNYKLTGKEAAQLFRTKGTFDYLIKTYEMTHTQGVDQMAADAFEYNECH